MRLNETLNLTINDVDFTRRTILIPSEINKGRRDRVAYYSQTMSKLLQRWLRFKDTMQETALCFQVYAMGDINTIEDIILSLLNPKILYPTKAKICHIKNWNS